MAMVTITEKRCPVTASVLLIYELGANLRKVARRLRAKDKAS